MSKTLTASNGVTVKMRGTPDSGLVSQALASIHRNTEKRKGEKKDAA